MKLRRYIYGLTAVIVVTIVCFALLFAYLFPKLDAHTAGIIGVIVGAFAGIIGSASTSLINNYGREKDLQERTKNRIAEQSLELTKLDYDLRQKSLQLIDQKAFFLAPVKVYREIYKTLAEFDKTGKWPNNLQEQGLLNIFPLGSENKPTGEK